MRGENLDKAAERIVEAAKQGAQIVCLQELFRSQYFCQSEDAAHLRSGRADPRADRRSALGQVARDRGVVIIASLFERRAAGLYHNTAAVLDADGTIARALPQDAHPRRPALLREVSTSRRATSASARFDTKFGRIGTLVCWDQWYPGGRAADRAARRRRALLSRRRSAGIRSEKARVRRGAGVGLADHPARPRHRQRRLRRGGQSRRARRGRPTAASSSGAARSSPIRSASSLKAGVAHRRGDPGRRVRPRAHRGGAPQLAVPARPPHRRLRAHHQPLPRRADGTTRRSRSDRGARLSACRPSGSRTRRPGSRGRTTRATGRASSRRSAGCTARSCACSRRTSACASSSPTTPSSGGGARDARARGRGGELGPGARADQSLVDARHRAAVRRTGDGGKRGHALALQRAGRSTTTGSSTSTVAPAIAARGAASSAAARRGTTAPRVVLEGGAIDVDGEGTLLATEECLQDAVQARNPELSARGARARARATSSAPSSVVWLGKGIAGDDTHGHIDDLARFVGAGPRCVLCQEPDARRREPSRARARIGSGSRARATPRGASSRSSRCRCRAPLAFEGQRLPASYANFYIAQRRRCWCRRSTTRRIAWRSAS